MCARLRLAEERVYVQNQEQITLDEWQTSFIYD
jgi:hypothetical protein